MEGPKKVKTEGKRICGEIFGGGNVAPGFQPHLSVWNSNLTARVCFCVVVQLTVV